MFPRMAPVLSSSRQSNNLGFGRSFATHVEVVPALGDSITEGTLIEWTKAVGEYVELDEVVAILETDKISVEIRASAAGTLTATLAEPDDTVEVSQKLFEIDTSGVAAAGGSAQPAAATEAAPAAATAPATPAPVTPAPAAAAAPATPAPKAAAAPASASTPAPAAPTGNRNERRVPISRMRQTIASRLKNAQNTAASLTTFNEIDMTNIMALRSKYKDEFLEKHGVKLGFMSIFVKASAEALMKYPDVNAQLEGKETVYRDYADISVAVSTPTGLVVPVLRNCEGMSFADVEKEIGALGQKARKGQIAIEDMIGGTFTISNGGVYGSLFGTPILNSPQSAILGMHGIFKRPVVVNNQIEIRPMMYVALTYDHRIIDGGGAVTFLKAIKSAVEDPERLLFEL